MKKDDQRHRVPCVGSISQGEREGRHTKIEDVEDTADGAAGAAVARLALRGGGWGVVDGGIDLGQGLAGVELEDFGGHGGRGRCRRQVGWSSPIRGAEVSCDGEMGSGMAAGMVSRRIHDGVSSEGKDWRQGHADERGAPSQHWEGQVRYRAARETETELGGSGSGALDGVACDEGGDLELDQDGEGSMTVGER
nr:hypothetical protein CFP56_79221 [Quercus suber]